jgi:uncharacterized protein YnzC (UPF0291/DUF896 family)
VESEITKETARAILNLRANAVTQSRVDELGRKSNEGTLTAEERSEFEAFVRLGNYLSLLQAKARKYLQDLE